MRFTQIDPTHIALEDERFRISFFGTEDSALTRAVRVAGLLNPPVLTLREGRKILVSGWKRVLSCLALKLPQIPVFVSDSQDDLELFSAAVYENASNRSFSAVEKAEILARLLRFGIPEQDLMRRFLPLLEIPPLPASRELYLALSGFSLEEKRIIHEKDMSAAALKHLVRFAPADRPALLSLLRHLGRNKQRELLALVWEIGRREGKIAAQVLAQPQIQSVLRDQALSEPQKADKVIEILRVQRSPTLAAWQNSFAEALKKLHIEKGIVIDPSPFFEGEDLSLHFSFKSREEFLAKLARLKKIADLKDFQGLFPPEDHE